MTPLKRAVKKIATTLAKTLFKRPGRRRTPPSQYDNLPKFSRLTSEILQELRRKTDHLRPQFRYWPHRLSQLAPDYLEDCSITRLNDIRRFSRRGGADLSDLRGVCCFAHLSTDQN
ncbi:hypothetical protein ASPVEDRAFT_701764 [Aspergillus versicolor CBS 583.65]|uniref:Uncharacterized protein n=1 Tax=Aspergillus versicolor CBS 583.65 TaxID=1036611 RepID=A0A1L9PMX9_ASPVE|nr:uncharacterized protein ASPVEDRAFT_701764 [Aspergillus versicolor CBS 583.65]OJJ02884.1 hypothetical protein ASPVEDRAFT_701764 [Aspergillus versicolor CBS 583.65]